MAGHVVFAGHADARRRWIVRELTQAPLATAANHKELAQHIEAGAGARARRRRRPPGLLLDGATRQHIRCRGSKARLVLRLLALLLVLLRVLRVLLRVLLVLRVLLLGIRPLHRHGCPDHP